MELMENFESLPECAARDCIGYDGAGRNIRIKGTDIGNGDKIELINPTTKLISIIT